MKFLVILFLVTFMSVLSEQIDPIRREFIKWSVSAEFKVILTQIFQKITIISFVKI